LSRCGKLYPIPLPLYLHPYKLIIIPILPFFNLTFYTSFFHPYIQCFRLNLSSPYWIFYIHFFFRKIYLIFQVRNLFSGNNFRFIIYFQQPFLGIFPANLNKSYILLESDMFNLPPLKMLISAIYLVSPNTGQLKFQI
jgi:hypothetical protein